MGHDLPWGRLFGFIQLSEHRGTFQAKRLGRTLDPVLINGYQLLLDP